jgi:processive 1,2-diacylglycerol beta-glucosyltransferase
LAPRPRLHVVCEYGADARPHASAFLRLIRPLTHPAIAARIETVFDTTYDGGRADAVVVDRLWRPDVTPDRAERLVGAVRRAGARLVYALDDNLLDLPAERPDWPTPAHLAVIDTFLRAADTVLVTSAALGDRVRSIATDVVVLPNALDERLLGRTVVPDSDSPFGPRPLVIGYMGTPTHDDDLAMVTPALREVCARLPGRVEVELVGVADRATGGAVLDGVPVRIRSPKAPECEYPLFLTWFTTALRWDIAIAPLVDTPFKRCKSDVKFLDYAAIGAAGVYSRARPYETSVRDGETGLLVGNEPEAWCAALSALVRDPERRTALATAAARHLHRERILGRVAPGWADSVVRAATGEDARTRAGR